MNQSLKNSVIAAFIFNMYTIHANAQFFKNIWYEKNQLERTDFDEQLLNYKTWSIHYQLGYYMPAYTHVFNGKYRIYTNPMQGYNVGLFYTFNREKIISFFTGIGLDHLPYFSAHWNIPNSEFPSGYLAGGKDSWQDINSIAVITIPIGIIYKFRNTKQRSNFYFALKGSINFHIMPPDDIGWYFGDQQMTFGEIEMHAKILNTLFPTINCGGGFNYISPLGIIALNIQIQKGIVPFYTGKYVLYNFLHAPATYATYNVRADYIGLDVAFTPKKFHPKY